MSTTGLLRVQKQSLHIHLTKSDIFDRFNKDGTYPTTVIIDANGVIQWIRQGNVLREDTNYLQIKLDEIIG